MKNKVSKGFTLVEVMIVVAIVGLLFAIAIPSFLKNKNDKLLENDTETVNRIVGDEEKSVIKSYKVIKLFDYKGHTIYAYQAKEALLNNNEFENHGTFTIPLVLEK